MSWPDYRGHGRTAAGQFVGGGYGGGRGGSDLAGAGAGRRGTGTTRRCW